MQTLRARVTSVVDGDTIRARTLGARGRSYTVRLIGIDTPERGRRGRPAECGAKQAISNMVDLAFERPRDSDGDHYYDLGTGGRQVTLTTDPTQDRFDRRGRLLAYVQTVEGTQLQLDQLIRGWAKLHVRERRFRRYGRFHRAQLDAKAADHGIWSKCRGSIHLPV
jgi:endonuclease YncB( thermonuclease family)